MTKRRPLTEEEWLASRSPDEMLHYLQQHRRITRVAGGQRRLRLFCVACCRSVWEHLDDERTRQVIEVSERFADGRARKAELAAACEWIERQHQAMNTASAASKRGRPEAIFFLRQSVTAAAWWATKMRFAVRSALSVTMCTLTARIALSPEGFDNPQAVDMADATEGPFQANLLRCIFGNPFRPVAVDRTWAAWNGGTVARLARAIYDGRTFDRLPVLADALEEAGCAERTILEHCRGPGPHARGCWVVDALLGKR